LTFNHTPSEAGQVDYDYVHTLHVFMYFKFILLLLSAQVYC